MTNNQCFWSKVSVIGALWMPLASVLAQNVLRGDQLPSVLKGVAPASGMCKKADFEKFDGQQRAEIAEPDWSCATTVDEFQVTAGGEGGVLLADLRTAAAYQSFHIAGSINLDLAALKSKPYWRTKPVVLVGSGRGEESIYQACAQLKKSGYGHVKVLLGGMNAWLAMKGAVEGVSPSTEESLVLNTEEFWQESLSPRTTVFWEASPPTAMVGMRATVHAMASLDTEKLKAWKARNAQAKKRPEGGSVIVVPDRVVDAAEMQAWQRAVWPIPLQVYIGNRESLAAYQATLKAVWQAHAKGPRQPRCGM